MTVTEFKKGDRVRVEFEGEITRDGPGLYGEYAIIGGIAKGDSAYILPRHLTLIAKPLEIGDVVNVVDRDDTLPEPPRCTIVTDASCVAWQKHADSTKRWYSGGSMPKNSLAELARTRGPLTVRYVPHV